MQKFSAIKFLMFAMTIISSMLYFQSCDNTCDSIECQNGGSCTDGACECPTGYGGDNCETFLTCEVLQPFCPTNSACEIEDGEAVCYCINGYEGESCDTLIRSFYTNGSTMYNSIDVCTVGGPVAIGTPFPIFNIRFTNGSTPDEFIMEAFGGFDSPVINVKGKITGKNTFTVPLQGQGLGWSLTVESQANTNGTLNRTTNKVTLPYQITYDDASVDRCTVEFTRQ